MIRTYFRKIFFICIFFIFSLFYFAQDSLAYLIKTWTSEYSTGCSDVATGYCTRGDQCPDCGTRVGACCTGGSRWVKYNVTCSRTYITNCYKSCTTSPFYPYPTECVWLGCYSYNYSATSVDSVCSVADKCLTDTGTSHNEIGLRAGSCDCSYGGIYKLCCSNTLYEGPVYCNKTNVDGRYPSEGVCPSGSTAIRIPGEARLGNGNVAQWWIDEVCPACEPANGASGVCATPPSGGTYATAPTSTLCAVGTPVWTDQDGSDGYFNWNCVGLAGTCNGANGATVGCSATKDAVPTLSSLVLKTYDGDTVAAESGSRNQMCQPIFRQDTVNQNGVQFVVTGADAQGVGDISSVQLRLRNAAHTYTFAAVAVSGGVATVPVDLNASGVAAGTYNIEVLINDVHASAIPSSWIDTGRDFKYWDCQVGVSGAMYDGSKGGYICPNFGSSPALEANFTSLFFKQSGVDSGVDTDVSGTSYSSKSGQYFVWGDRKTYSAQFNSDLMADLGTMDLRLNNTCSYEIGSLMIETAVDPYADNPSLTADFLAVVDQDAWFQSNNGGILSRNTITDYVPVTCGLSASCTEGMSIGSLVAAPTINATDDVNYSYPNNWHTNTNVMSNINYFEKYKLMKAAVVVAGDLSDPQLITDTEGLLLIDGNVDITTDKITPTGTFVMLVAKGDINISPNVTRFDGILVANNINIGGDSNSQLVINGSLHGFNQVNISRTYTVKRDNNDSPAVLVNFRPDFIFNMPTGMVGNVVDWKWGN